MMMNGSSGASRALALALVGFVASACVSSGPSVQQSAGPRSFSYDCGDGASLSIESLGDRVSLTDPEGETVDLPASPPGQASRYGQDAYAVVIGDHDALWMKAGKKPVSCRR